MMARPRRKAPAKKRGGKPVPRKRALTSRTRELQEALEQQAATAEVLKAISTPAFDLQSVLDSMTATAARLCKASDSTILLLEGDAMVFGSHFGEIPVDFISWKVSPNWTGGRAVLDRKTVHVRDMQTERGGFPEGNVASSRMGYRTILTVPMMHGDRPVGALTLRRTVVRPFTAKQVALAESFATQTVIAIENARLLRDLRNSLERQTATGEVLTSITASLTDTKPVFETIVRNLRRLFDTPLALLLLVKDGMLHVEAPAQDREFEKAANQYPRPVGDDSGVGQAIKSRDVVQFAPVIDNPDTPPVTQYLARELGFNAVMFAPMMLGDTVIGAIATARRDPRAFDDKETALIKSFAAQAVIAIENARLFDELRAKTEELRQLNEQLEKRVADQVGEIERMGRLRRFLPPQVADLIVSSGGEKQLESHRREITALFCDLRGFTAFAESADPEDVMALLRDYHAAIGRIIFRHGGTLERFVGDGVMVIFNDPLPLENPSLHAVQMALEMRAEIGALAENWRRLGHDIGFGIGVAHGYATLGTIGFEGRFDYAAIGTVSNLASRLCDEAKAGQILISARVLAAVQDSVTVEPAGELTLKGIRRPVEVFNVIGATRSDQSLASS
jgi:class 3 adenylate cyclase/GAF domain-containing protein